MSAITYLTTLVQQAITRLNFIETNAKKVDELPHQTTLEPTSKIPVSRAGNSEHLTVQQIIDSIQNSNYNQLLAVGSITVDGTDIVVQTGVSGQIDGNLYGTSTDTTIPITLCDTGFNRKDILVLTKSNTVVSISGEETDGAIVLAPPTPPDTVYITEFDVSDSAIGLPEDPIIGTSFVKKSFFAPFISTVTGDDAIIPLDPNGYTEIRLKDASLTSIAGFNLSLITGVPSAEVPYNGKPYIIRNLTGNDITIKNELGAADYPFFLSGGADLVFPNGQAIYVLYDASGFNEIFKSWSTLDEATDFGNTTTNNITTGIITTPMVKMPKGSFNVELYPVDLTGNRKLEAPNKNGIIATLDDIPSNPITGTGTINRISKFTSSGVVGDSQIYDNGTNVGIGTTLTTPPQARLDVRAQGALSTDIAFRVRNSTDTANLLSLNGLGATTITQHGNTTLHLRNTSLQDTGGPDGTIIAQVMGGFSENSVSYGGMRLLTDTSWLSSQLGFFTGGYSGNPVQRMVIKNNGNVGINTSTPVASAQLQVDSTTRGFLPPRMTTTQRNAIASPAAGLIVYDTTENKHYGFNGTTWNALY